MKPTVITKKIFYFLSSGLFFFSAQNAFGNCQGKLDAANAKIKQLEQQLAAPTPPPPPGMAPPAPVVKVTKKIKKKKTTKTTAQSPKESGAYKEFKSFIENMNMMEQAIYTKNVSKAVENFKKQIGSQEVSAEDKMAIKGYCDSIKKKKATRLKRKVCTAIFNSL